MPFQIQFLFCLEPNINFVNLMRKAVTTSQGYLFTSASWILWILFFLSGVIKMFLCIFINNSRKCISAHERGNNNREEQHEND